MGRHRNAGGARDRRGAQPAGDAADAHEVGHHEIAGFSLQRRMQIARAVEILADLDRRLQFRRKLRIAVEIVVDDRLLDPGETQIVDHVTALERVGEIKTLVEIGHQFHVVTDGRPDGFDRGEIIARGIATEPQLQPGEAALVAQCERFGGQLLRRLQPSPLLL